MRALSRVLLAKSTIVFSITKVKHRGDRTTEIIVQVKKSKRDDFQIFRFQADLLHSVHENVLNSSISPLLSMDIFSIFVVKFLAPYSSHHHLVLHLSEKSLECSRVAADKISSNLFLQLNCNLIFYVCLGRKFVGYSASTSWKKTRLEMMKNGKKWKVLVWKVTLVIVVFWASLPFVFEYLLRLLLCTKFFPSNIFHLFMHA